ncbi:MAG: DUF4430 domain-containing protein [Euryarchaeota archaeon]|nr:DUF4430 domain-containing protein [Euryarchaeota archaeon]
MEKRNLIVVGVICVVVLLAGAGSYMYSQQETERATVRLVIEYNEQKDADTYEDLEMPEGSTVLDLLEKETDLQTKDTEYGKMIVSINGVSQDKNKGLWWIYTVNGEQVSMGAEGKKLSDGDVVQWTLTKY